MYAQSPLCSYAWRGVGAVHRRRSRWMEHRAKSVGAAMAEPRRRERRCDAFVVARGDTSIMNKMRCRPGCRRLPVPISIPIAWSISTNRTNPMRYDVVDDAVDVSIEEYGAVPHCNWTFRDQSGPPVQQREISRACTVALGVGTQASKMSSLRDQAKVLLSHRGIWRDWKGARSPLRYQLSCTARKNGTNRTLGYRKDLESVYGRHR